MSRANVRFTCDFWVEHWFRGRQLWTLPIKNRATKVGLDHLLNAGLNNTGPTANWFLGLISGSSFDEVSDDDTSSSHGGWAEFTGYTSATRPAWGQGAASGQIVANASVTTFTCNSTGTFRGMFAISNSTKGGSTGILLATAVTTANRDLFNGSILPVYYRVLAASGD